MLNLLKVDAKRFKKDLIFKILLIVIVGFAVATVVLYKLISVSSTDHDTAEFIANSLCGKELFINALSPSQTMGLLMPVLLGSILAKDYVNGTIRNKIISGYSKRQIYISSLLVVLGFGLFAFLLNGFLNLALGSIFFGFGTINATEIGHLFINLGISTIVFIVFLSLTTMVCHLTKSVAGTIMIVLGFTIAISIIGSILANVPNLNSFAHFILMINPIIQVSNLDCSALTTEAILYPVICSIIYIMGSASIGVLISQKTDNK